MYLLSGIEGKEMVDGSLDLELEDLGLNSASFT